MLFGGLGVESLDFPKRFRPSPERLKSKAAQEFAVGATVDANGPSKVSSSWPVVHPPHWDFQHVE
jgi:hypothetical protein